MPFDMPAREWADLTPAERCRSFAGELEAWEVMGARFPDGEPWDYTSCERCAMGYAVVKHGVRGSCTPEMAEFLAIPEGVADDIFIFGGHPLDKLMSEITPSDIASLLRKHADKLEADDD